jgi:hypothetical protein
VNSTNTAARHGRYMFQPYLGCEHCVPSWLRAVPLQAVAATPYKQASLAATSWRTSKRPIAQAPYSTSACPLCNVSSLALVLSMATGAISPHNHAPVHTAAQARRRHPTRRHCRCLVLTTHYEIDHVVLFWSARSTIIRWFVLNMMEYKSLYRFRTTGMCNTLLLVLIF